MRNALFTRSRLLMKLLHSDTATTQHPSRLAIGIRREDPLRIWERRCPLTPEAVEALIAEEDVDVFFQPCERRIFTAEQFIKARIFLLSLHRPFTSFCPPLQAGAKPHKTLAPAHIILGIKETPLHELLTDPVQDPRSDALVPRTHVMFLPYYQRADLQHAAPVALSARPFDPWTRRKARRIAAHLGRLGAVDGYGRETHRWLRMVRRR